MTKVSLVKSKDSYKGVTDSLKLIEKDLRKTLKTKKEIIIKINFVTTYRELATTPFMAVKAFVDFIRPFYSGKIIIAEEATFGNTDRGFTKYGFAGLAKSDPNIEVFNTAKDQAQSMVIGKTKFSIAKLYAKKPFLVSICRPKTHDTVVMTASLKNVLVGAIKHGIFKKRFLVNHSTKLNYFLATLAKKIYPGLAIIDGTVGMEGNGPAYGTPIKSGWAIASFDALAADSLTTYLMGFDIKDVGYLNLIREEKLGKLYPKDKIEILGENPAKLKKNFKPHKNFKTMINWNK